MSTDWRYGLQGKALVIQRRRQEPTTSGGSGLSYYQSGENKRVADEKAIGDIKQKISLNENLLYDKALNDSLTATDYNIILGYFTEKTDIDSKIMACNILTSSENYDEARQQISSIRSLGTTEAINCADVMDMYINTMDTLMTKEMLMEHQSQLESYIADNNYLYSGIATALYEYAFDTLVPEYTPIYEEVITSKSTKADAIRNFRLTQYILILQATLSI